MTIAVFDIDGVVADVRHRLHHLHRHRSWHGFFRDAADDPLLPEGARLAADLATQHEIVWLTGRPEWLRRTTEDWLDEHRLPGTELHLRPDGDYRPARIYNLDVLRSQRIDHAAETRRPPLVVHHQVRSASLIFAPLKTKRALLAMSGEWYCW